MRKLWIVAFALMLVGCGNPTAPIINTISPTALTAPTLYDNPNTQKFELSGEKFVTGAKVVIGTQQLQLEYDSLTSTSIVFYIAPPILNPNFPENLPESYQLPVQVRNPNGQISNTVQVTVVPHCNPCGT